MTEGIYYMAKETVNIHACLDRREGNKAVLLLGDEENRWFFH